MLTELGNEFFGFRVDIGAYTEEIDGLYEILISEENAKVGDIETLPELFPRNQSDKFGFVYIFELFGE